MCKYYSAFHYILCAHVVPAAPLPIEQCVVQAVCATEAAARRAALGVRPPLDSDESLNQWRARLHRDRDEGHTETTPDRHPCFQVEFVPHALWTVTESAADPLQGLCPACRATARVFDRRWARMLDALVAASDAAAAGAYWSSSPVHPPCLRELPGDVRAARPALEQIRADVLARRGAHCVFRGLGAELRVFERVLLAAALWCRPHVPEWPDYTTLWNADTPLLQQLLRELDATLAEGYRLLDGTAAPELQPPAAPRPAGKYRVPDYHDDGDTVMHDGYEEPEQEEEETAGIFVLDL